MTKDEIDEIRIDIESGGQAALSMAIHRDGTLGRQGSGSIPMTEPAILGMTDGRYFTQIMELVYEEVFQHAGAYDYPEKHGVPVSYSLAFFGPASADSNDRSAVAFRVAIGTDHQDVHPIVKYVDTLSTKAVAITQPWYVAALDGKRGEDLPGGV